MNPTQGVRQRGSVAVELAFVLLVLVALLMPVFLIARVYFYYNVATNAANVAARYAARGTYAELQNGTRATNAGAIVNQVFADAGISVVPSVQFACQPNLFCSPPVTGVTAAVRADIPPDTVLFQAGLYVTASSTVKYP